MKALRRMVAGLIGTALIAAAVPAVGDDTWTPTPQGWVTGPVEHVGNVAREVGTAVDAVLHDDHLYVTAWRSFSIYDVNDPLDPQWLSTVPLAGATFNEEPQTNGEILLISRDYQGYRHGVLDIYGVRDKADPQLLGTYQSTRQDHLWTCVLDCAFAYSATGTIVDLSDPAAPVAVGDWSTVARYGGWHHITEVAPGLVLTGTVPAFLLDANEDPTSPTVLATTEVPITDPELTLSANPHALPARIAWPRQAQDRLGIVSMETPFMGRCTEESGKVHTFDTTGWEDTGTFTFVDEFQIADNGTFTDGHPAHNVLGCSAYGLDVHPGWGEHSRVAAVTFFEHGVRILQVDDEGHLHEVGGFLPLAGNSAAVRWVAEDLLYVIDLHRGIDVLRVDLDAAA